MNVAPAVAEKSSAALVLDAEHVKQQEPQLGQRVVRNCQKQLQHLVQPERREFLRNYHGQRDL